MSSSIDQRIVEMQFNNRQFESGVQTSIKSLDDLKKGLNLEGAAKGLSNLERAGNKFTLAGLSSGIENLNSKFSALGIMGVTALQNITNSAINAGKRITASLTIDPIFSGFEEYETKMGAIQTILTNTASKGTTLKDVNAALEELNLYADQTTYNFAEMTRNIGTFTAAGVNLKTATASIKGIANLAAGSGSSAIQASTAMYQLSQAIAAGSVKLMDWNSVVNAGMGGELFQNALRKTAKEMGVVVDAGKPFRETLQDGWLTSKVLTKTLEKFAEDKALVKAATQVKTFTQLLSTMKESVQSGWAKTWETIIGDKDESANMLTAINDAFAETVGKSAEARNKMLEFWKANGGRTALLQGIANALIGLSSVLEPIEKGFTDIFPAITGQRLVELTKGFRDLMANFKIGEQTANNLRRTFRGVFALLDIGRMALVALGNGLLSIIKYFAPAGSGILSFTGNIGDFIVGIRDAIKSSDAFNTAIQKIGSVLKPVADFVKAAIGTIIDLFNSLGSASTDGMDAFAERVKLRFEPFAKLGDFVSVVFSKISDAVRKVAPGFFAFASAVGQAFDNLGSSLAGAIRNADFNKIFDMINGGMLAAILLGLRKFINGLTEVTSNAGGGGIKDGLTDVLDGVKGSLEQFQSSLKANVLIKIAIAIGILAIALVALASVDSVKLTVALSAMTAMFVELFGSMAIFEKLMGAAGFLSMQKITLAMIALSIAILILSKAVTTLAKLDWKGLERGLTGVAVLAGILVASAKLLQNSAGMLIRGSIGFILFAASIRILTGAVAKLAEIDSEKLSNGLVGIGVLIGELALFMKATNLSGMGVMKGLGLIAFAAAVNILAEAVRKFSELDSDALIKGLVGLGVVLAQVAIFVKLTGDSKRVITTALGLVILGGAMLIFAKAVGAMGSMSWDVLGKGLLTMAGALTIVGLALRLMPANMVVTGAGLVIIASSLLILSKALISMGAMTWDSIVKGLVALAGALTIIAVAMKFMTTALPGAAALLIIAGALTVLTFVLTTLGNMSLAEIGKGLLALVGVFTVLGVASVVLAPLIPVLISLAGAVALFGLGCLAVGAGLLLFSTGLAALAVSATAGSAAIVLVISTIAGLIPMALIALAKGIIGFIKVIGDGAPEIAKALGKIIEATVKLLVEEIPIVVEGLLKLLTTLLETLLKYAPRLIEAGAKLIIALLEGLSKHIEEIIEVALTIVANFLKGVASKIGAVIDAGIKLMISFINGMADGIRKNTDKMIEAMDNLTDAILEAGLKALTHGIDKFVQAGKDLVNGMIKGIKSMIGDVANCASGMANSVIDAAKNTLGIHSPSKLFKAIGENIGTGLAKGIDNSSNQAEKSSTKMTEKVTKNSKKAVKASAESAKKAFQASLDWIDERKYYNLMSLQQELVAWQDLQNRYKKGSEERKKVDREVYRVRNEIVKDSYQHSIDWIEREKYYNRLSLQQELAAWIRVHDRYKEGSEERMKADREIYRLENELRNEVFQNSLNWIDKEKAYNRLALEEELAAWKRVQARYKEGSEERKKADGEIYRVEKEINQTNEDYQKRLMEMQQDVYDKKISMEDEYYQKTKDVNDKLKQDIKTLTDEYERALESRADALYSAYNLFDKVERPQEDAKKKVEELKAELVIAERTQQMYKVGTEKRRQADEEAIKVRKELAAAEEEIISGSSLIRNLQSQVKTFELWKDNIQVLAVRGVDQELIKELESMGPKAIDEIQAINTMSKPELDKYVTLWKEKHQLAKEQAGIELEDMRLDTINQISELEKAASDELDKYRKTWVEKMVQLSMEASKELTLLEREWLEKIGTIRSDTEKEFDSMVKNSIGYIESRNWSTLGTEVVSGLVKGIKSQSMMLTGEIADAARGMLETMKKELGIQSPSVEFAKIGMFAVTGLVNGLKNNAKIAMAAGSELGQSTKESLRNTFLKMGELLTSEDMSPTIRPVLDMSNVENSLASTFGKTQGISVSATASKASSVSTTASKTNLASDPVTNQTNNTDNAKIEINNSYVVRNDNDIRKISSDLKNTLIKYNKAKGVVLA